MKPETAIRARRSIDCARKVKVEYLLPCNVYRNFLSRFPGAAIRVEHFSQHVAGARDHFSIAVEDLFCINGSFNDNRLFVTFWKQDTASPSDAMAFLENILTEHGYGQIVLHESSQ